MWILDSYFGFIRKLTFCLTFMYLNGFEILNIPLKNVNKLNKLWLDWCLHLTKQKLEVKTQTIAVRVPKALYQNMIAKIKDHITVSDYLRDLIRKDLREKTVS